MAFGFVKQISPEYVLGKAFLDMKKKGLDGLMLTFYFLQWRKYAKPEKQ